MKRPSLKEKIGLPSATVLVIANMVGTGIFTTSGFIIQQLENPQAMLLCWFIGGIFALAGALCYGELGALFPKAGGEYVYLRESLGKLWGFLSGWISLVVGFSAPIAASAIAFSAYMGQLVSPSWGPIMEKNLVGGSFFLITPGTLLACTIITIFSFIHADSLRLGSRVQNILTSFKIILILGFISAGLVFGKGSTDHFLTAPNVEVIFSNTFAVSLIFISFAYSGWNAAAYLGGEIVNPQKNLPVALVAGTMVVIGFYVLLNIVYIYALPVEEMSGVVEVGAKAAVALFGPHISPYVAGAIALGLLSVISAMIMAGPRVYYAMAVDQVFFRIFAKLRSKHKTPAYSIFLQAMIADIIVITATFDKLLVYIGFTLSLFAVLTVTGLVVLRIRRPTLERSYKTWGYPVTPALFIVGNLWILYFSITEKPVVSFFGLATIAAGTLVYFLFSAKKSAFHRQSYH